MQGQATRAIGESDMLGISNEARSSGLAQANAGMTPTSQLTSRHGQGGLSSSGQTMTSLAKVFGGALNAYQQNEAQNNKDNKLIKLKQDRLKLDQDAFIENKKTQDLANREAFDNERAAWKAKSASDYTQGLESLKDTGNAIGIDLTFGNKKAVQLYEKAYANMLSTNAGKNISVKIVPQTNGGQFDRGDDGSALFEIQQYDSSGKLISTQKGVNQKDLNSTAKAEMKAAGVDEKLLNKRFDSHKTAKNSWWYKYKKATGMAIDAYNPTSHVSNYLSAQYWLGVDDDDSMANQISKGLGLRDKDAKNRGVGANETQAEIQRMQVGGFSQKEINDYIEKQNKRRYGGRDTTLEYSTNATSNTAQSSSMEQGGEHHSSSITLASAAPSEKKEFRKAATQVKRHGVGFIGKDAKSLYYQGTSGGIKKTKDYTEVPTTSIKSNLPFSQEEAKQKLLATNPKKYENNKQSLEEDSLDAFNKSVKNMRTKDKNIILVPDRDKKTIKAYRVK